MFLKPSSAIRNSTRLGLRVIPVLLLCTAMPGSAESWVRTLTGPGSDWPAAIARTADHGYVVAGATTSAGAGGLDGLVVRLDPCGNVVWQNAYGGAGDDLFTAVVTTADGNIVVAGESDSFGGSSDWWVVRLDGSGSILWQRRYGLDGLDVAHGVAEEPGGSLVIAGSVRRADGTDDGALLALNDTGSILWAFTAGGPGDDVLLGVTSSNQTDWTAVGFTDASGTGIFDAWVLRTDGLGNLIWQNAYGGEGEDTLEDVVASAGTVIVVGTTDSADSTLTDQWVAAIDPMGTLSWQIRIGGNDDDTGLGITLDAGGGVAVVGDHIAALDGTTDALVSYLGPNGLPTARRAYGAEGDQDAVAIDRSRGGVVLAGVDGSAGHDDVRLIALDAGVDTDGCGDGYDPVAGQMPATLSRMTVAGHAAAAFVSAVTTAIRVPAGLSALDTCRQVPGEISPPNAEPLRFISPTVATWEPAGIHCATSFNLYGGDLGTLPAGGNAACLEPALATSQATVTEIPASGSGRFYLVTGQAAGGEGPAGNTSASGPRIIVSYCSP